MFEYFLPILGLVTTYDSHSENAGLFLAQYAVSDRSEKVKNLFISKMEAARLPSGLYRRSAEHNTRSVSHDEITGMMSTSYMFGLNYHKEIWNQMVSHNGAYPAIIENKLDYVSYNPGNYYAWCEYQERWDCGAYYPFYKANMMIALNKPKQETSSKLIYWLELNSMPVNQTNEMLKHYYEDKMKKQYGNNFLFEMRKIYFSQEDENEFPLLTILKED